MPTDMSHFIQGWANKINAVGLSAPAIFLLEAHKPLSFMTSQLLVVSQPILNLFFAPHLTRNVIQLFADRSDLEKLIKHLEQNRH